MRATVMATVTSVARAVHGTAMGRCIGWGWTLRRLFLLLEPCSGGDLWAALDRADPITPEQVALRAAHFIAR